MQYAHKNTTPPRLWPGCYVIRVLYGRRIVGDDGYLGLRFAYLGLSVSPAARRHMLRMHRHNIVVGICDTPIHTHDNYLMGSRWSIMCVAAPNSLRRLRSISLARR